MATSPKQNNSDDPNSRFRRIIIPIFYGILIVFQLFFIFTVKTNKDNFGGNSLYITAKSPPFIVKSVSLAVLGEKNDLIDCLIHEESRGDVGAYNPKDVDGRPKFGILQFDANTYKEYCVKSYSFEEDVSNPQNQIECCKRMVLDGLGWHWGTWNKCISNVRIKQ